MVYRYYRAVSAQQEPIELVRSISFGSRVAEDEADELRAYFVQTETWRQVREGEIDVVLAPKGSGKSAIYSMLLSEQDELFDEKVLLAPGENMSGTPAFAALTTETSLTESELIGIWKLYFLVLISEEMEQYDLKSASSKKLFEYLRDAGLLPEHRPKATLLTMVREYVARLLNPKSAETSVSLDGVTGAVTGFAGKIEFSEPSFAATKAGHVSIDTLYALAEKALQDAGYSLWIVLDRLDAAFAAFPELERNALRALFRAYGDLASYKRVKLKIFLRSDIWENVTDEGFREASHIVRETAIAWDSDSLRQLVVRRLTRSDALLAHYGQTAESVLASTQSQTDFFYEVFAQQVDAGSGKTETWKWALSRTEDGSGTSAPRELIHLFSEVRNAQLVRHETAQTAPESPALFHPKTFDVALPVVSKARLAKTIYAEFSDVKPHVEKLARQKTEHNLASLGALWGTDAAETTDIVRRLVSIGFLAERAKTQNYWVPFMYRPALEMVQGKAEGVA